MKKFCANLSRRQMESLEAAQEAALISISDPGSALPLLRPGVWKDILTLRFYDILEPTPLIGTEHMIYDGPEKAQAALIANFIREHQNDPIVVHCEQGKNRSATICKLLVERGWEYIKTSPSGLDGSNQLLEQLLRKELQ
jgi:predicted protein tyrosine phosphatase